MIFFAFICVLQESDPMVSLFSWKKLDVMTDPFVLPLPSFQYWNFTGESLEYDNETETIEVSKGQNASCSFYFEAKNKFYTHLNLQCPDSESKIEENKGKVLCFFEIDNLYTVYLETGEKKNISSDLLISDNNVNNGDDENSVNDSNKTINDYFNDRNIKITLLVKIDSVQNSFNFSFPEIIAYRSPYFTDLSLIKQSAIEDQTKAAMCSLKLNESFGRIELHTLHIRNPHRSPENCGFSYSNREIDDFLYTTIPLIASESRIIGFNLLDEEIRFWNLFYEKLNNSETKQKQFKKKILEKKRKLRQKTSVNNSQLRNLLFKTKALIKEKKELLLSNSRIFNKNNIKETISNKNKEKIQVFAESDNSPQTYSIELGLRMTIKPLTECTISYILIETSSMNFADALEIWHQSFTEFYNQTEPIEYGSIGMPTSKPDIEYCVTSYYQKFMWGNSTYPGFPTNMFNFLPISMFEIEIPFSENELFNCSNGIFNNDSEQDNILIDIMKSKCSQILKYGIFTRDGTLMQKKNNINGNITYTYSTEWDVSVISQYVPIVETMKNYKYSGFAVDIINQVGLLNYIKNDEINARNINPSIDLFLRKKNKTNEIAQKNENETNIIKTVNPLIPKRKPLISSLSPGKNKASSRRCFVYFDNNGRQIFPIAESLFNFLSSVENTEISPQKNIFVASFLHPQFVSLTQNVGATMELIKPGSQSKVMYKKETHDSLWNLRSQLGSKIFSVLEMSPPDKLLLIINDFFSICLSVGALPSFYFPSWGNCLYLAQLKKDFDDWKKVFSEVLDDSAFFADGMGLIGFSFVPQEQVPPVFPESSSENLSSSQSKLGSSLESSLATSLRSSSTRPLESSSSSQQQDPQFYESTTYCKGKETHDNGLIFCYTNILILINLTITNETYIQRKLRVSFSSEGTPEVLHSTSPLVCSVVDDFTVEIMFNQTVAYLSQFDQMYRVAVIQFKYRIEPSIEDWVRENLGAILGSLLAVLALFVAMGFGLWFMFCRKRSNNEDLTRIMNTERDWRKRKEMRIREMNEIEEDRKKETMEDEEEILP